MCIHTDHNRDIQRTIVHCSLFQCTIDSKLGAARSKGCNRVIAPLLNTGANILDIFVPKLKFLVLHSHMWHTEIGSYHSSSSRFAIPFCQRIVFRLATMVYKCKLQARFVSFLPYRGLHTAVYHSCSAAPAIGWQIGTACSKNTNCDIWSAGFRGGRPGGLEFSASWSKRTDSLV